MHPKCTDLSRNTSLILLG